MIEPLNMSRHEFLAQAHDILRPRIYMEIGVQHGPSLNLAVHSERAIGIDPQPLVSAKGNQTIYEMRSDTFFMSPAWPAKTDKVNMGFIDGEHLAEYALRDFFNMEKMCADDGVIFFDDVLPRNQGEARRAQCPGDWTGDVWKVSYILAKYRPDLELTLVSTFPTGILMVRGLNPLWSGPLPFDDENDGRWIVEDIEVPAEILYRSFAWEPQQVLRALVPPQG